MEQLQGSLNNKMQQQKTDLIRTGTRTFRCRYPARVKPLPSLPIPNPSPSQRLVLGLREQKVRPCSLLKRIANYCRRRFASFIKSLSETADMIDCQVKQKVKEVVALWISQRQWFTLQLDQFLFPECCPYIFRM